MQREIKSVWISMDDDIPEFNYVVLVWDGFAIMQACLLSRANGERYFSIDTLQIGQYKIYACPYKNITHWMALPELPICNEK